MSRQDTNFRIISRVSEGNDLKDVQSVDQASVPITHLKMNAPVNSAEGESEYPFEIENNYERIIGTSVLPSCAQHEFRCQSCDLLRVRYFF